MDKNKRNMLIGAGVCVAFAGSYLVYKKFDKKKKLIEDTNLKLNLETLKSHIDFITSKDQNINIYFGKKINNYSYAYVTELDGELKLNILSVKGTSIKLSSQVLDNEPMKFGVVRLKHMDKSKVFYTLSDDDGMITAKIYSYNDNKIDVTTVSKHETEISRDDTLYVLLNPTYHGGYLHPYEYTDTDYVINNELMELIDCD